MVDLDRKTLNRMFKILADWGECLKDTTLDENLAL